MTDATDTTDEWLRPLKIIEYYLDWLDPDLAGTTKELYLAVINGDVRAQLNGRVLGPEWLKQVGKLKNDPAYPFELPPDLDYCVGANSFAAVAPPWLVLGSCRRSRRWATMRRQHL